MQFRVLGPVEVAAGGRSMTLGAGHRRTILAVLLAAGGGTVTTDRLIASVWEGDPPASARKSLQSHLSRLRAELDDVESSASAPLVSVPDGYRLDLRHHGLDAARFESLAVRAREVLPGAPGRADQLLTEALALWRGHAFGDLAAHPGIRAEAVRLERMRADTAGNRVDALLALGRADEVIGELERAIVEEPLSERAHGQLMVALYRTGRQADALAVHQVLRDRLRDELGVDPSPAIRELHGRILRQDPALGDVTSGPHSTSAGSGPRAVDRARLGPPHVDLVPSPLVGRDHDVTSVAARLESGTLVTLTGPGGVGKTRLAERVAAQVADRFVDGVVVAELAAVRDPASVGEALVTALGIQPTGDRTAAETLVAALGERRVLLLLDNCEHVLGAVASLATTLLSRCPNVAVLATSRERLRLGRERLWPVAPLQVPDTGAGREEVAATAAGALFCVRAEAVEPSFELTETNTAAVAELCRRLDGMPLAIELAAARVRALSPQDLVGRLDQRFSLLAGGPRHRAGRHRTLRAVVAWSYELLDPVEARLFDRLSVFSGAFSLEAAEQVCAGGDIHRTDVAGVLGELVDKSMIVVDRRRGMVRYRFLDTLREYGARRLAESDDPGVWRRAHAAYHVALAERLGRLVRGPDERGAVGGIDGAFDDLRSAHAWLVDAGDVDAALRLPAALPDYAFYRLRDEVTTWARRSVAQPGASASRSYAAALAAAAYGATSRDECDRARREAADALDSAAADELARAWALGAAGTAALYEGRLDDLLDRADQLAAVASALGSAFYAAFAGVLRVIGHTYRGEPDAAFAHLQDLDTAAEASGSPTMRAFARYCRGEAHIEADPTAAVAAFEDAVRLAREVDNALVEGVSMVSLASLRGRVGDAAQALAAFREVVAHWRRLGDHTHQLTTLRNLVVLLTQLGADEPAAVLHGAVAAGLTPSFGLEAQRLADAWGRLQTRLGPTAAAAAADRGRMLRSTQVGDVALRYLDALTDG